MRMTSTLLEVVPVLLDSLTVHFTSYGDHELSRNTLPFDSATPLIILLHRSIAPLLPFSAVHSILKLVIIGDRDPTFIFLP